MLILAATAENAVDLVNIDFLNATIIALLGYAVVFLGLILLMCVVTIMGKIFVAKGKRAAVKADAAKAAVSASVVAEPVSDSQKSPAVASGTAGQLKLHDVPPKTAAMIMAIVADKMGKPLNELRFISIKEVK